MIDHVFPAKSPFPDSRTARAGAIQKSGVAPGATQTKPTLGRSSGEHLPAPANPKARPAPVPPPVYRPQQTPGVAQPKSRSAHNPGRSPHRRAAPPVYRPEAAQVAQARKASGVIPPATVNAPPVYRPRPEQMRKQPLLSLQMKAAGQNAQTPRATHQVALQARMATSVIQRTVWEWDGVKQIWMPLLTEGQPTPRPTVMGYSGQRISTGGEDPWAAIAERVVAEHVAEERDATWKGLTRLPLYAETFGVQIKPSGCHSEEEILAQLTGKRAAQQDKSVTKIWTARAEKIAAEKALKLELNAWPCRGSGDPNCHVKLSQFAAANGVTVTVKVVGDSGGYESGHRSDPNWVDGATEITYTGTTVTYSK